MTLEHRTDDDFEENAQPLFLVMGGRVTDPQETTFQDPDNLDCIGIFSNYEKAFEAWRAAAQRSVDDAFMKYMIVRIR